jgi:diguanylate cyclase (GGDEF)-like protein/PAS domain S-box-containing protein
MPMPMHVRDPLPSVRSGFVWWMVLGGLVVLGRLAGPDGTFAQLPYLTATVGGGVLAWFGVGRCARDARHGLAWIAAGVSASGLADATYFALTQLDGVEPDASIADVFWLMSYVFLIVAVLGGRGAARRWSQRLDGDGWIDLGTSTVVVLLLMSQVADLGALIRDDSVSVGVRLVWITYPVLDAILMAALVLGALERRHPSRRAVALFVGIGSWLLSDFVYMSGSDGSATRWLDVGWMIGALVLGAATFIDSEPDESSIERLSPVRRARVALTLVPLLIPSAVLVVAHVRGRNINPIPLAVASAILVACGVLRGWRLIRARDEQQRLVQQREHYSRILTDISTDAVIVVGNDGEIARRSAQLDAMLGLEEPARCAADLLAVLTESDRERVDAAVQRLLLTADARAELELEIGRGDGDHRWLELRLANLTQDPVVQGIVVNATDITRRKHAEYELVHLAFHDALTGLPNRALYQDRLEHALRRTTRTGHDIAVIFLDIDGFKAANDRHGHTVGDHLLQQVARRLEVVVRSTDTIARLGGDEFAILIDGAGHPLDEASTVAERALQAMCEPFTVDDNEFTISASIGIAIADPESTATTLLRDADVAMYQSKANGKAQWTIYDTTMRSVAAERLELELDLINVLPDGQLRLVYQPILQLETETVVGFEALVRWDHPTRGPISPDQFIPIAETNGMIIPIGEWVLHEACFTAAAWHRRYPDTTLTISVNISARQLADPNIVGLVERALSESGLAAGSLVLELTETALVQDPQTTSTRLGQLRQLGVKLAIDDFGTGYSSLSYLRQFPVDILKIDRSFISSITDRARVPAIVRGLLDLGRTLQLTTVAEGIELADQLTTLQREECEYGQGFLFARPLTEDQAADLIAEGAREVRTPTG